MRPFVILGMPRARTAWLAQFLSYGERVCLHEPSRNWAGADDLHAALDNGFGLSDSMLTLRWRDIAVHVPAAPVVVVHRSKGDVLSSFRRAGLWHDRLPAVLNAIDHAIDDLTDALPAALHVPFDAMHQHDVCARVFTHCLGGVMPFAHWHEWRDQKVLADAGQHISDGLKNVAGVRALYPELMELAA